MLNEFEIIPTNFMNETCDITAIVLNLRALLLFDRWNQWKKQNERI